MTDLAKMRAEWEATPSPILRNDMDWLRNAPSDPFCAAGNISPRVGAEDTMPPPREPGGTDSTWRDLFKTMLVVDMAVAIIAALCWLLAR